MIVYDGIPGVEATANSPQVRTTITATCMFVTTTCMLVTTTCLVVTAALRPAMVVVPIVCVVGRHLSAVAMPYALWCSLLY